MEKKTRLWEHLTIEKTTQIGVMINMYQKEIDLYDNNISLAEVTHLSRDFIDEQNAKKMEAIRNQNTLKKCLLS